MPPVQIVHAHLFGPDPETRIRTCLQSLAMTGRVYLDGAGNYLLVSASGESVGTQKRGAGSIATQLMQSGLLSVVNNNNGAIPPRDLLSALAFFNNALHNDDFKREIPAAVSVVRGPAYVVRADRLALRARGLDPDDRVFTLSGPTPAQCSVGEYPHLHKLFSGVHFADPVYHANLLGYTVAMFARTALQEFPLLLLDSRYKSCGKSTVGRALGRLLSSWRSPPFQVTFTGAEDEVEKKFKPISGTPGPSFILFDNVRAKRGRGGDSLPHDIRSQFLAQIATSKTCYPRVMNEGCGVQLFDPVAVLTMNRAHVEHDLHDRTVRLLLTRPTKTAHFKLVPHPEEYVVENRPALLSEIHAILSSLALAPIAGATFNSRFYRFEQIAVGAARALGLDACYGGDRVDTCDSLLRELYTAVTEDFTDRAPDITALASTLNAGPSYTEFRSWFSSLRVPVKAYPKYIRELMDEVVDQPFRIDGRLVSFALDFDERLNQPTVKVVYNEA